MDVSGGYAVAGSTGVFGGTKGKVTIFAWDTCNSSWVEQTYVQGSDTIETDLFGSSLSLRGTSLIVGANYKDMGSGSSGVVYAFGGSGSSWSQTQKITAPNGTGQRFGLGIAQTSTTLALTSPLGKDPTSLVTYTGAIAVYTKGMNGLWQYRAILVPAAAIKFDGFGYSVAMDGNNLVGGAPGTFQWSANGQGAGKAWVFNGSVSTWNETGALAPSDGADNDWFGRAGAIAGNTIIVGAPRHDSAGSDAGAAYIFSYANGSWTQSAKLTASDAAVNANFGFTVAATSESHVLIGAPGAGKVYAFTKVNGTWTQDAAVQTACSGGTGWALGVSGNMMITGKTKATMFDLADPNTACVGP